MPGDACINGRVRETTELVGVGQEAREEKVAVAGDNRGHTFDWAQGVRFVQRHKDGILWCVLGQHVGHERVRPQAHDQHKVGFCQQFPGKRVLSPFAKGAHGQWMVVGDGPAAIVGAEHRRGNRLGQGNQFCFGAVDQHTPPDTEHRSPSRSQGLSHLVYQRIWWRLSFHRRWPVRQHLYTFVPDHIYGDVHVHRPWSPTDRQGEGAR